MKKEADIPYRYESLSDLHRMLGLPKPLHPLISLIFNTDGKLPSGNNLPDQFILSFYKISYKPNLQGKMRYGQHYYDHDEGGLFFISPNQVTGTSEKNIDFTGFTLFIHPDFLLGYPLAKRIKQYGIFSYAATEVLHLSDAEKTTILTVVKIIDEELKSRIDDLSQDVIISQLELLLNYGNRFHKRQFVTRKAVNNDLLQKMEEILDEYFTSDKSSRHGIPTVQYLSDELHISPSYLSDMLRSFTGQNAQQHIHHKLIEKAKERLSTTNLSISEIAYELGFEHPQSLSALFKTKTTLSPLEFRRSFN
ncbi:MAG: helix-turn-helix transcriptional regulator [Bacteroidota bacterium]|nr:helix-turn-helix transcriptional regulator [Bacteroidota bacterium]